MAYNYNNFDDASMNNEAPSMGFLIAPLQPNVEASNATIASNEHFEDFLRITDRFRSNVHSNIALQEERAVAQQLRTDLEHFTTENNVLMAQQPPSNINYVYMPIPMRNRNTEQPLDLTRSIENRHPRSTMVFLGLDTPNVTPQKYEMPTGVTTPRRGVTTQVHILQPIEIFTSSTNNNSTLKRELDVDNSDSTREMQPRKKMKTKTIAPYMTDLVRNYLENHTIIENGTEYVKIGTNCTKVQKQFLQKLNWNGPGAAITRKLLTFLFDRQTLATHTITGKPSPAFLNMNKPQKGQLNPLIINDIIEFMVNMKVSTPREVKIAISTKCADECKQYRRHQPAATSTTAQSEANVITAPEAM